MAIRMTTSLSEINAMFDTGTKQIDSVTIQALANLGNECVTEARSSKLCWLCRCCSWGDCEDVRL